MNKIQAVKPADFQTAEHRYNRFDCFVSPDLKNKDLENPDLWTNVASRLKQFDEVRVIAEDHSFVAYLIVLFSQGTDARLKLINGAELENLDNIDMPKGKYDIKLCGPKKFVIFNVETGENVKEGIATKLQAYKELEDYITALRL